MANWKRIFFDNFDNATVDVDAFPGNGSITEPAGSSLIISALAGADCRWWTGPYDYAPAAGVRRRRDTPKILDDLPLGPRWVGGFGYAETRWTALTYSDAKLVGGLAWWKDRNNAYWIGWYPTDSKLYLQKVVGDYASTITQTAGTVSGPSVSAHRYRFYFNTGYSARVIDLDSRYLYQGQIAVYYSVNDGGAWTFFATIGPSWEFDWTLITPFVRNWGTPYPSFSASFDWLGIWVDEEEYFNSVHGMRQGIEDKVRKFRLGADPREYGSQIMRWGVEAHGAGYRNLNVGKESLEDYSNLRGMAGNPLEYWNIIRSGVDIVQGGVIRATPSDQKSGFEDAVTIVGANRHQLPIQTPSTIPYSFSLWLDGKTTDIGGAGGVGGSWRIVGNQHNTGAIEDVALYALASNPLLDCYENDPDGRPYFGSYEIRTAFLYHADTDPWDSHGAGHYGAGRDGIYYFNGETCGPPQAVGGLGTIADGLNGRAFGQQGTMLDFGKWTTGVNIDFPADGELRFNVSGTALGTWGAVRSMLRWALVGDFEIDVEWSNLSFSGLATDGGFFMEAYVDSDNYHYIRRRCATGQNHTDTDTRNNGSWMGNQSVVDASTSGKYRLKRVGAALSAWRWTGSAWAQIGSSRTMTHGAKRMTIQLGLYFNNDVTSASIRFKNLNITSGSWTNKTGWFEEAAGTYRGSRQDFPEHALISCAKGSLDIIDADNLKLWMSFRYAASNVIQSRPVRAFMRDGILFAALASNVGEAEEGGAVLIDFNLDYVRIHRPDASGITGADYMSDTGTDETWGTNMSRGNIIGRNGAYGWRWDRTQWRTPAYRTRWVDLFIEAGHVYRVVATDAGLVIFDAVRWRLEGDGPTHYDTPNLAFSTETNAIFWCRLDPSTRDLLFADSSKVYVVHQPTWSAQLNPGGGTFIADHTWSIAPSLTEQDRPLVGLGTRYLFARDRLVWLLNPTTGALSKLYGVPGSGATYPILPSDLIKVDCVNVGLDAGVDVDVLGLLRSGGGQVMIINQSGGAVRARGAIRFGREPLTVSA